MRHAILGVGGVGGLVGAALAHAGDDVALVVRPEHAASYPASLSLESPFGNFSVPVRHVTAVTEAFDVLWITVKATQLDSALNAIQEPEKLGAIVPLLNGVDHVSQLRNQFGDERVVPATIRVESERIAPGEIVHRSPFVRLDVASAGRERLEAPVEKLKQFGFTCQFVDDEATMLWGKLVFLAAIALTGTAFDIDVGEIMGNPERRRYFESCLGEACVVATASGATVDLAAVMRFVSGLPGFMRSSMQKDVASGNPPELDAIAGPIIRGAEKYGLEVPVTKQLVTAIRERMAG